MNKGLVHRTEQEGNRDDSHVKSCVTVNLKQKEQLWGFTTLHFNPNSYNNVIYRTAFGEGEEQQQRK